MNKLDIAYQQLLQDIIDFGIDKQDRTGTGTKSIFGYTIRHNMQDGFPLLTTKKMAFKTMVTELLWFLRGDTNIKYLHDNGCHIWDGDYEKSGRTDGELGPIYGKQWRKWSGASHIPHPNKDETTEQQWYRMGHNSIANKEVDQIQNLINDLKTNPDSRRLMVNAWNVGELGQMVLPPCHYGFQVYTRELSYEEKKEYTYKYFNDSSPHDLEDFEKFNIPTRAISLMWNQRSVDTFLGLPFNIASYGLLLEIIAKEVNMVPDELIGNLGDVHLYKNHIEQAKEQITREPMELPSVQINRTLFEGGKPNPNKLDLDYYSIHNFELLNYQSHPAIKAPLSN